MERRPITAKPSIQAEATWWQWINFTWPMELMNVASTRHLAVDDLGGLEERETIEVVTKEMEDMFYAQPENDRSILKPMFQVFKRQYVAVVALVVV